MGRRDASPKRTGAGFPCTFQSSPNLAAQKPQQMPKGHLHQLKYLQVVLHTPIRIVGSRSVSSTTVAARKGWIKPPPQVIRSDILSVSLHKQKPRPVPETFKFSALDSGNTGTVPMCNWNARQREWLVDCLNTIFDNCVVRSFRYIMCLSICHSFCWKQCLTESLNSTWYQH